MGLQACLDPCLPAHLPHLLHLLADILAALFATVRIQQVGCGGGEAHPHQQSSEAELEHLNGGTIRWAFSTRPQLGCRSTDTTSRQALRSATAKRAMNAPATSMYAVVSPSRSSIAPTSRYM